MARFRQYIVTLKGRGETQVKVRALNPTDAGVLARSKLKAGKVTLIPTEENLLYDIHIKGTEEVK